MKAAAAKKTASTGDVFAELKAILLEHGPKLRVLADTPKIYTVAMAKGEWEGKPLWAGCVRSGKAYTSFHLMPLYSNPELVKKISPELKRRMQGKTCFNFKAVDAVLFSQLRKLTATGLKGYNEENVRKAVEAARARRKKR